MTAEIFKWTKRITIPCFLMLVLFVAIIAGLILTGKRSIPYATEYVEQALNDLDFGYKVTLPEAGFAWKSDGLNIVVLGAYVSGKEGNKIVSVPETLVKIDISSLLFGSVKINSLTLQKPTFMADFSSYTQQDQKKYLLHKRIFSSLLSYTNVNGSDIAVEVVRIEDAVVNVGAEGDIFRWDFPSFTFKRKQLNKGYDLSATVEGIYNKEAFKLQTFVKPKHSGQMDVSISIVDFSPTLITQLVPGLSFYNDLSHKISGEFSFVVDANNNPKRGKFSLLAKGDKAKRGQLNVDGTVEFLVGFEKWNLAPEIEARAIVRDLPMQDLKLYWPPNYASPARQWVTSRISKGAYTKAEAKISISAEEMVGQTINDDSIKAVVEFDNAEVNYFEELPMLQHAKGKATFNNNDMHMELSKGVIESSRLTSGIISIIKRDDEEFDMEINASFDGRVQNLLAFYGLGRDDNNDETKEFFNNITGQAETNFRLSFPLEDFDQLDIKLLSTMQDVEINELPHQMSLKGGVFDVKLYNDSLAIEGNGYLNGVSSQIKYKQYYRDKSPFLLAAPQLKNEDVKSVYSIKMEATAEELNAFGVNDFDSLSGILAIEYEETETLSNTNATLDINADNAAINLPQVGYDKADGVPLNIAIFLASLQQKGITTVDRFSFVGEGMDAAGTAAFSTDPKGYQYIKFDQLRYGRNDLSLSLARNKGIDYTLSAKGKGLDLSPYFLTTSKESDSGDEKSYSAVIDLGTVTIANAVQLNDVSGTVKCGLVLCDNITLDATFPGGAEVLLLFDDAQRDENGVAKAILRSADAGKFLNGFDINSRVTGGTLEVSAQHREGEEGLTDGKILMNDFAIIKAPVLGKILTLASFGGILDILNGKGVTFEKMKGEFDYKNDQINMRKIKLSGNSLGITAGGNVNTSTQTIDIEGTAASANLVNTILGKLPLIGKVFTGKEGEGLIATRYSIKGDFNNPDVTVNPLSMLTPGFLQRIWGGGVDSKNTKMDTPNTEVISPEATTSPSP